MSEFILLGGTVINEGSESQTDIWVKDDLIYKIGNLAQESADIPRIDSRGKYVMPGVIDDQVHFREPGLTHKADIRSESAAAAAGGVTSFMEMPNTVPQSTTLDLLEDKYQIAAETSTVNYSFYLGATNSNVDVVSKVDPKRVCGIKVFMGSSTGNMLVDDPEALEAIFKEAPMIIAAHCEDEGTIKRNTEAAIQEFGENIPMRMHPVIRNHEACYLSSSKGVELAHKTGARFHVLHISTAKELELFEKGDLADKKVTSEACIHHLWFSSEDYDKFGSRIKWNPAVKDPEDRAAILQAVIDERIDVMATDHAPHTKEEKANPYLSCPSGGPLVQHVLVAGLELTEKTDLTRTQLVKKLCHDPARLFSVSKRGFLREGYKADIVVVDDLNEEAVAADNILYKCGWSPFEGMTFKHRICRTIVNGTEVYNKDGLTGKMAGERLVFER